MLNNTSELVEKKASDLIHSTGGLVRLAKVGFTANQMKLITEEIEQVELIVEERNGKKSMYIEGVFLQGDIKNEMVGCILWIPFVER